jgi:hypothetical protein
MIDGLLDEARLGRPLARGRDTLACRRYGEAATALSTGQPTGAPVLA